MGSLTDSNGLADAFIRDILTSSDNTTLSTLSSYFNTSDLINISTTESSSGDGNSQDAMFRSIAKIVVPTIFGIIGVLGLFGNSLVILVVLFDKHMRNTTNVLILSLAVADLLFILFCVPFTATKYAMTIWPFGSFLCKLSHYAMYVCAYASVYTLMIMSLDRYLAVVHAIRSMTWRTERNTWFAIAIIWFIMLCGNTPILDQFEIYSYEWANETRAACLNNTPEGKIFLGCFLFFGYVIPLGITMLLYGLMLKRLLYGVVPGGGNQSAESIRAKKRVTRMVVIVIVMFALCWLPIQVLIFWENFFHRPQTPVQAAVLIAANCLAYMNSCVNPILYAFLSENFRRSFRKLLCCSESSQRRLEYERTNIRFTVAEKETMTTPSNVTKTYTPV